MMPVLHGPRCIGFIFNRGPLGFEAYDAAEISCGIFPTADAAANALTPSETNDE
jgi:hypothetical protein